MEDGILTNLSWVLNLNTRWLNRNLDYFLQRERYIIAANVMLYESRMERASEYFEEALRLTRAGSERQRRLTVVLANLDTVSKIARIFWELEGKHVAIEKSRYAE